MVSHELAIQSIRYYTALRTTSYFAVRPTLLIVLLIASDVVWKGAAQMGGPRTRPTIEVNPFFRQAPLFGSLTPLQLETRFWGQNYLDLV